MSALIISTPMPHAPTIPTTARQEQHAKMLEEFELERQHEGRRVFKLWKNNIQRDPTMIIRNDPRWWPLILACSV